jgi:hypothetical protein
MKKLSLVLSLLFILQFQPALMAQIPPDVEEVHFTANLNGSFDLVIEDGGDQVATFNTYEDYNDGVSETAGIVPGFTTVTMRATGNWYLQIHSEDFMPNGGTATGSIPINNLGVHCEATGVHQFGVEVKSDYTSQDVALGLTTNDVTLIDLNSDDSGDENDNKFILHWLMGTKNGSMNTESMFKQLSDGIFTQGQYLTTVTLTMTEIPQ